MIDIMLIICVSLGTFFMFVAAIGIVRLPDFYQRIHAPTKAATLGLMFLLIAVALAFKDKEVMAKAFLAFLFFAVTAPVGAHLLCRAASRKKIAAAKGSSTDIPPKVRR